MKILLAGGAGRVGTFVTPYLRRHHELRVLDLKPPRDEAVEFVAGSVTDPEAIQRALQGVDAFIWLVMQRGQGGAVTTQDIPTIVDNYEVNAKGLHLLLFIAQQLGIKRGVYTSTMSVHYRKRPAYPAEELVPLDTPSVYGLTKGFGELICQYFARWFDMNLIALRITGPRARREWLEERRHPRRYQDGTPEGDRLFVTDEEDLANAYLAALQAVQVGHGRFDAVFIAGDEAEEQHNLSKARRLLGWTPQAQRLLRDLPEG
ncbi:MAG TPA: NAD(P)-dependent oxidoreductase [Chloroflexota bacterium]|jgi:nucleoside-diphosphate-sugar epimerase|nr:NAD(P)-dependent oxidoreductase [Chloroflexota bacterium]